MTIVQQHTVSIALFFFLCEGIQTTRAEIMLRLNHLDKQRAVNPPLLPTPSILQHPNLSSPTLPNLSPSILPTISSPQALSGQLFYSSIDNHNPRLPKLELPMFSGENPLSWLFQIFFLFFFLYHIL